MTCVEYISRETDSRTVDEVSVSAAHIPTCIEGGVRESLGLTVEGSRTIYESFNRSRLKRPSEGLGDQVRGFSRLDV